MKKFIVIILILASAFMSMACDPVMEAMAVERDNTYTSDAAIARRNLETAEQNFQVYRRVVFYNGITGDYILQLEGYIAIIIDEDGDLIATVKMNNGEYLKHYLGLSDNVTYFSEALASNAVSDRHYKVIFKPSAIIPTIELD